MGAFFLVAINLGILGVDTRLDPDILFFHVAIHYYMKNSVGLEMRGWFISPDTLYTVTLKLCTESLADRVQSVQEYIFSLNHVWQY